MTNKFLNYVKITLAGTAVLATLLSPFISDYYNKARQTKFIKSKPHITQEHNIASLHNHTFYSDGKFHIEDMILNCFKEDYSIFAVTDHDNEKFYQTTKFFESRENDLFNFKIKEINNYTLKITDVFDIDNDKKEDVLYLLKGSEITTKEKYHVVGIGYNERPQSYQSLEEIIIELKKQDAIIISTHPAMLSIYGMGEENVKKFSEYFDAIEVNGAIPFPLNIYYNGKAKKWGEKYNIPVIASPDAHINVSYFNTFAILMDNKNFNENNIKEYIKTNLKEEKYKNLKIQPNSIKLYKWQFLNGKFKPKDFRLK
jgi:predicted metal-dependent phosphoesterase TrpH